MNPVDKILTPSDNIGLRGKRSRFNPLTHLTPLSLARQLDAFEAGYLREAVNTWEALELRDDLLRTVIAKRKKAVARRGWTILPKPGVTPGQAQELQAHTEALTYFYSHLTCEHAVDQDQQGGFKLLARQMMDAVGKKFAVHEIVWRQSDTTRGFVTAKFRFVPLAFFENTTGQLRFLESESAAFGRELEPGAWMITAGDGLMIASAAAWMYKHLALEDWLRCSQRNGTPGLRGISAAARDSEEWNALERSLARVLDGQAIIHGASDDIQVIDLLPRGTMPFPPLVERTDRLLAALWRGADLSTLSRDRGYGASLQEKETCALEEDDAEMLTEALNRYVDEWVIRQVFGEGAQPLAAVKVLVTPSDCAAADMQVDEFLLRHGAPLSIQETLSRYGRTLPKANEAVFPGPAGRKSLAANDPESSQRTAQELPNQQSGAPVTFRDRSPAAPESPGLEESCPPPPALPLENDFRVLQPDWVQLSPYGDFPHNRGLQRLNREAAEQMAAQFQSLRGRIGRLFGGAPFYVGHPDLPGSSELADRKAYGWVTQLEAREDGLYGQVQWSEAGRDLLRNAHYKYLSPFWEAREIGSENGRRVYQPIALVSVGLTNQPNIPVRPLANEQRGRAPAEASAEISPVEPALASRPISRPRLPTVSRIGNLGTRRGELALLSNRRDRIQDAVQAKMRLGLPYDDAWQAVKRERPNWFEA